MAFAESFSVSQSALTESSFTVLDDSTGVDGAITQRRIYVSNSEGEYLTGDGSVDYDEWAFSDIDITLDLLTASTAVSIKVDWLNSVNVVLYTLTNQYCLAQYTKNFLYYLVQMQGDTPGIVQDSNYFSNLAILWSNLRGAINAIEVADDLSASQNCLNRCTEMENNQNLYF
jgi:hypothetical protein